MVKLLRGAEANSVINTALAEEISRLRSLGVIPAIALVRVGESQDDLSYQRSIIKRCEKVGIAYREFIFPVDTTTQQLLEAIKVINEDDAIHGCLILRPLPRHIDDDAVRNALLPKKDLDGITDPSLAGVFAGKSQGYPPCTAQACIEMLDAYEIPIDGKKVVVIGRSLVVGRPVAALLMARNATVTVCHTHTAREDLINYCRQADIIIAACGQAAACGSELLHPGQIVLDVGINVTPEGNLVGDVDFAAAEKVVEAITPVPGGIGAVTTSVLIKNLLNSAAEYAVEKG